MDGYVTQVKRLDNIKNCMYQDLESISDVLQTLSRKGDIIVRNCSTKFNTSSWLVVRVMLVNMCDKYQGYTSKDFENIWNSTHTWTGIFEWKRADNFDKMLTELSTPKYGSGTWWYKSVKVCKYVNWLWKHFMRLCKFQFIWPIISRIMALCFLHKGI